MIFETVREQIALPDAAQLYGISSRNGNIRCIFHADSNPLMKLYTDHFHCFGCGAHGDVTDFTAQLYGLSKLEAARKLRIIVISATAAAAAFGTIAVIRKVKSNKAAML